MLYVYSKLSAGSIENLYAEISAFVTVPETKSEVDVMEVVGAATTVRAVLENLHGLSFTDFHSLVKISF